MEQDKNYKGFNFEYRTEEEKREHEKRCKESGKLERGLDNVRFASTDKIGP